MRELIGCSANTGVLGILTVVIQIYKIGWFPSRKFYSVDI